MSEQCAHRARGDDAHTTIALRGGDATGACRGAGDEGPRSSLARAAHLNHLRRAAGSREDVADANRRGGRTVCFGAAEPGAIPRHRRCGCQTLAVRAAAVHRRIVPACIENRRDRAGRSRREAAEGGATRLDVPVAESLPGELARLRSIAVTVDAAFADAPPRRGEQRTAPAVGEHCELWQELRAHGTRVRATTRGITRSPGDTGRRAPTVRADTRRTGS